MKQKMFTTMSAQGGWAPVISTFADSVAYPKADANEFRGKVGAARALSKMKTWTRRVTRTRNRAAMGKVIRNGDFED